MVIEKPKVKITNILFKRINKDEPWLIVEGDVAIELTDTFDETYRNNKKEA